MTGVMEEGKGIVRLGKPDCLTANYRKVHTVLPSSHYLRG
mgnify:CR=1 FL=1